MYTNPIIHIFFIVGNVQPHNESSRRLSPVINIDDCFWFKMFYYSFMNLGSDKEAGCV